jgi:hypothetical protein
MSLFAFRLVLFALVFVIFSSTRAMINLQHENVTKNTSQRTLIISLAIQHTKSQKKYTEAVLDHMKGNRKSYAAYHGYNVLLAIDDITKQCNSTLSKYVHLIDPIPWFKVAILIECLRVYQRVVWIDVDALILKQSRSIDKILRENCILGNSKFFVAGDDCCIKSPKLNTGFWIIEQSLTSFNILEQVLRLSEDNKVRYHEHWENHAAILNYRSNQETRKNTCIGNTSLVWFPSTRNTCQKFDRNNFIGHWAGGGINITEFKSF